MGKGATFLKLSGFMENSKILLDDLLKRDPALAKLPEEFQIRYRNACVVRFLPRYEEAAAAIVEKKLPADVLDKCIQFLDSDAGRKMVYYQMLSVWDYSQVGHKLMREVVDELIAEDQAELQKAKDQERRDRNESKPKKPK